MNWHDYITDEEGKGDTRELLGVGSVVFAMVYTVFGSIFMHEVPEIVPLEFLSFGGTMILGSKYLNYRIKKDSKIE